MILKIEKRIMENWKFASWFAMVVCLILEGLIIFLFW
jgi:hypothetical protein